jgi:hypothetical protein
VRLQTKKQHCLPVSSRKGVLKALVRLILKARQATAQLGQHEREKTLFRKSMQQHDISRVQFNHDGKLR